MLTPRGGFPADACKGGDRNLRGVGWGVEGSRTIANVRYSPFTASDRMSSRSKTQEVRHPALALVKEGGETCTKVSGNQRRAVRMVTGKEHDDGRGGSTECSGSSNTCDAWDHPGLLLEELLDRCPDATWNQVFAVVDHLSRTGDIRLTPLGMGKYHVNLHAAQHSPGIYK